MEKEVCLVIPIYNEGKSITKSINELVRAKMGIPIILVEDGSTDDSREKILPFVDFDMIHFLPLEFNLGYGKASWAGIKYASSIGFQWAIIADSDLTNPPSEIHSLRTAIRNDLDLIKTDRFSTPEGMSMVSSDRRWKSKVASLVCRLCFGLIGRDGTNGFRALRIAFFKDFSPIERGFPIILEELVFALKHSARISYLPTKLFSRGDDFRPSSFDYSLTLIANYFKYCIFALLFRVSNFIGSSIK